MLKFLRHAAPFVADEEKRRKGVRVFGEALAGATAAPFVEQSVAYLVAHGLRTRDLFRTPGNAHVLAQVRAALERGKPLMFPGSASHGREHVVAALLKAFLLELPQPLIGAYRYDALMHAVRTFTGPARLRAVKEELDKEEELMAPAAAASLWLVTGLLADVARHSVHNGMNAHALAIILAPCLLRPKSDDVDSLLRDHKALTELTQLLIEHQDYFFNQGVLEDETDECTIDDADVKDMAALLRASVAELPRLPLPSPSSNEHLQAVMSLASPTSHDSPHSLDIALEGIEGTPETDGGTLEAPPEKSARGYFDGTLSRARGNMRRKAFRIERNERVRKLTRLRAHSVADAPPSPFLIHARIGQLSGLNAGARDMSSAELAALGFVLPDLEELAATDPAWATPRSNSASNVSPSSPRVPEGEALGVPLAELLRQRPPVFIVHRERWESGEDVEHAIQVERERLPLRLKHGRMASPRSGGSRSPHLHISEAAAQCAPPVHRNLDARNLSAVSAKPLGHHPVGSSSDSQLRKDFLKPRPVEAASAGSTSMLHQPRHSGGVAYRRSVILNRGAVADVVRSTSVRTSLTGQGLLQSRLQHILAFLSELGSPASLTSLPASLPLHSFLNELFGAIARSVAPPPLALIPLSAPQVQALADRLAQVLAEVSQSSSSTVPAVSELERTIADTERKCAECVRGLERIEQAIGAGEGGSNGQRTVALYADSVELLLESVMGADERDRDVSSPRAHSTARASAPVDARLSRLKELLDTHIVELLRQCSALSEYVSAFAQLSRLHSLHGLLAGAAKIMHCDVTMLNVDPCATDDLREALLHALSVIRNELSHYATETSTALHASELTRAEAAFATSLLVSYSQVVGDLRKLISSGLLALKTLTKSPEDIQAAVNSLAAEMAGERTRALQLLAALRKLCPLLSDHPAVALFIAKLIMQVKGSLTKLTARAFNSTIPTSVSECVEELQGAGARTAASMHVALAKALSLIDDYFATAYRIQLRPLFIREDVATLGTVRGNLSAIVKILTRALLDAKHAVTDSRSAPASAARITATVITENSSSGDDAPISHSELIEQLEVAQSTLVRVMKASLRLHDDPERVYTLGQVVRAISVVLAHPSEPGLVREALLAPARPLPLAHRAKVAAQHRTLLELAVKSCADSRARLSALQSALAARTKPWSTDELRTLSRMVQDVLFVTGFVR